MKCTRCQVVTILKNFTFCKPKQILNYMFQGIWIYRSVEYRLIQIRQQNTVVIMKYSNHYFSCRMLRQKFCCIRRLLMKRHNFYVRIEQLRKSPNLIWLCECRAVFRCPPFLFDIWIGADPEILFSSSFNFDWLTLFGCQKLNNSMQIISDKLSMTDINL